MTARERGVRLALRLHSRSYAWAPEVRPHGEYSIREHAVVTSLTGLDGLDRTSVVLTHAATTGALTIQRP